MPLMTTRKLGFLMTFLVISSALQGCAGVKTSYNSLIETKSDVPAIYLRVGETKEVLSISNGFPGWWGVYPTVVSYSPEIASVECRRKRSWIPFRSPGLIFGGEVCYVTANKAGESWLRYGNSYSMDRTAEPHELEGATKIIVSR